MAKGIRKFTRRNKSKSGGNGSQREVFSRRDEVRGFSYLLLHTSAYSITNFSILSPKSVITVTKYMPLVRPSTDIEL